MMKSLTRLSFFAQRRRPFVALATLAVLVVALAGPGPAVASIGRLQERPAAAAPRFESIDAFVAGEMRQARIPGVALAIVEGDEIVHRRGFGRADATGRPVTAQTPFNIASTGKSITALAVMQLVEAGRIELDAPVQRYVPWFAVDDPAADRITVRHLLHHTSGITREAGLAFAGHSDDGDDALESRVRALAAEPLFAAPGESFQYSNANYSTLGLVVQAASGQSYEAYVRAHILAPLQMGHTFLQPSGKVGRHGEAAGHRYWFGYPVPYTFPYHRGELPAGFIYAGVEDMARLLVVQLNKGRFGREQLLSPAGVAEMHRPAVLGRLASAPDESDIYYGMGWKIGRLHGRRMVYHEGAAGAFHADLLLLPDQNLGVVLLMNGEDGRDGRRINRLAAGVASLLIGEEPPPLGTLSAQATFLNYTLVVVAFQIAGIALALRRLRRWRASGAPRPTWSRVGAHILLPLLLNGAWAATALVLMPFYLRGSLADARLFAPDFGYTVTLSGGLALVWSVARTALFVNVWRRPSYRSVDVSSPVKERIA